MFKRKKNTSKKKRSLRKVISHLFHPQKSNNHRSKVLHPSALFYFVAIIIGFFAVLHTLPGNYPNILGFATDITIAQVVEQTNIEREKHGLTPVKYNRVLSQAATAKGQDMFTHQYWAHTSPQGKEPWDFIKASGYSYKVAGENLARDFMGTEEMTVAWMASPTHKANILNPKFEEIGIAVIDGKLKGFETTLVVQMFGTQSEAIALIDEGAAAVDYYPDPAEIEDLTQLAKVNARADSVFVLGEEISFSTPALFTPLQLTKAFFLAVIILVILTLLYDGLVSHHKKLDRKVGKNIAHILMLSVVAFLVIFFKGGFVQ